MTSCRMESHKVKLMTHYDALTDAESGIDVIHVTDYLRRDNSVGADECEEIESGSNCRVRAQRLLEVLLEKDELAYRHFREALLENYPHFAQLLDDTCTSLHQTDSIHTNALTDRKRVAKKCRSSTRKTLLPAMSTVFVGREREKGACLRWLQTFDSSERLYTFIGPPGVGKTALVIKTCHDYTRSDHPMGYDQILFFDLRCVDKVEDLAQDMLLFLGESLGRNPINLACNIIRSLDSDLVLVLDNAEDAMVDSLKDAFLGFIEKILKSSSRVRLILTSRVSVKLLGVGICEVKLSPLEDSDGASLATSLVPSLQPSLVNRLCRLTGYLPLGLHLLAILLKGEDNPEELVSALEDTPGSALTIMQNVEGISSSSQIVSCFRSCFDRLDSTLQNCILACAVFPSGFDRYAAQGIFKPILTCNSKTIWLVHTQRILRSLEDRSMLMFDESSRRYSLHPLLKSFCETMAHTQTVGWETTEVQNRFCEYFVDFAENTCVMFFERDCCSEAVHSFWSERQNIEHAIQICLKSRSLARLLLRFASRKGVEFLRITLPDKMTRSVYDCLLEVLEPHELVDRSMVLTALAFYTRVVEYDMKSSLNYIEEARRLQDESNVCDIEKRTFFMHSQSKTFAVLGRFEEAEQIAKDSLRLAQNHPHEQTRWLLKGFSVEALAGTHRNQFLQTRDVQKAKDSSNEYNAVLTYLDKFIGEHIFHRYIFMSHGQLRGEIGDLEGALHSLQKALHVQGIVMGNCVDHLTVHCLIGEVYLKMKDVSAALRSFQAAFSLSSRMFGPSERTVKCGQKIIQMLQRYGYGDRADWYEKQINIQK